MIGLIAAAVLVMSTASCSVFVPRFGLGDNGCDDTLYQSAMADFALCETAQTPDDRAAAAAQSMAAVSQPLNSDPFYEMDRVVAADTRCQATLAPR